MPTFEFDSQAQTFSPLNALRLAEASLAAYLKPADLSLFLMNRWDIHQVRFIENAETQVFVCAKDSTVLVAYRGTEQNIIQDWITDFKIKRFKTDWGMVHSGFHAALNLVWNEVLEAIEEFAAPNQNLWFTGHSLGGALATLSVSRLLQENLIPSGLYTFGQPRVGGPAFASEFDQRFQNRMFRFANNNDIVARVPLGLAGYKHVGRLYYFDRYRTLHVDPFPLFRYYDQLLGKLHYAAETYLKVNLKLSDFVDDHEMKEYITNINRLIPSE